MDQTRRDVLKAGGGAVICACAGAGISACAIFSGVSNTPSVPADAVQYQQGKLVIELSRVPALAAVGGSAKWASPDAEAKKVCIIRSAENQFDAFIDRCAHGGRELEYRQDQRRLRCASFGHSEYDLEGRVLGGPAKGNLTKLTIARSGSVLEIAVV